MSANPNVIEITEEVIDITVTSATDVTLDLITDNVQIEVNNLAIPTQATEASQINFSAHTGMSSSNVQAAIEELADNAFRSDTQPTSAEEGDTWYDLDDNQFKVYRETAADTFEWVPIILGSGSGDSDTLDAGAF